MNPAGSRNPAGFYWIIPQSRGIEKTRDLVNCIFDPYRISKWKRSAQQQRQQQQQQHYHINYL